ncbi:AAA family ATPase [Nocardia tengchongensis]|uniref:AAA family ATPase n=1 Tax=Nocardia tengchongensis TaxID=2055889 RepID=UPI00361793D3
MNRAPSTNGDTAGQTRPRGGYDNFFTQPPAPTSTAATANSWRDTVTGRTHRPPPEPNTPGETPTAGENPAPNPTPAPAAPPNGQAGPMPRLAGSLAHHDLDAPVPGPPPQTGDPSYNHNARPAAPYTPGWTEEHTNPHPAPSPSGHPFAPPAPPHPSGHPPTPPMVAAGVVVPEPNRQSFTPGALVPDPSRAAPERPAAFPIALTPAELLSEIVASRQSHLRSTSGMRGALNKVGFNLGLSPAEQRTEDRRARIRRQLTNTHQVAVVNVKGGVGRTTTVAALGSTFADLRPDRVVAVDANPDFGDLSGRTCRHPYGLTLRDLAQAPHLDAFSAVQSFTAINQADLAVIASPWSSTAVEALSGREYLAATEVLRRHFNLLLIDCGTGVLDSATATVLQNSNAILVVTPATVRGVTGAVATLEWLDTHGMHRLAAESIIAIVHQHPAKPMVETGRIEELFAAAQRPTFVLPYDEHLAEGGEIDLRLLEKETALAFEELAAALADGFPNHLAGRGDRGGWQ